MMRHSMEDNDTNGETPPGHVLLVAKALISGNQYLDAVVFRYA